MLQNVCLCLSQWCGTNCHEKDSRFHHNTDLLTFTWRTEVRNLLSDCLWVRMWLITWQPTKSGLTAPIAIYSQFSHLKKSVVIFLGGKIRLWRNKAIEEHPTLLSFLWAFLVKILNFISQLWVKNGRGGRRQLWCNSQPLFGAARRVEPKGVVCSAVPLLVQEEAEMKIPSVYSKMAITCSVQTCRTVV